MGSGLRYVVAKHQLLATSLHRAQLSAGTLDTWFRPVNGDMKLLRGHVAQDPGLPFSLTSAPYPEGTELPKGKVCGFAFMVFKLENQERKK